MTSLNTVFYHKNCFDGLISAFSVWKKFLNEEIEYIGCSYDNQNEIVDIENYYKDKNILLCDFNFNLENTKKILNLCKTFIILDHHKTTLENFNSINSFFNEKNTNFDINSEFEIGKNFLIFDMDRSGAMITWQFFFKNQPIPNLIKYIQDRDLWKFQYKETEPLNLYLSETSIPIKSKEDLVLNFSNLNNLLDEEILKQKISIGETFVETRKYIMNKILENCTFFKKQEILGKKLNVAYINCPYFKSELGSICFDFFKFPEGISEEQKIDFVCIWNYAFSRNKTFYSLRSRGEDVSLIAKKYNGGGHQRASGLEIKGYCPILIPQEELVDIDLINDNLFNKFSTENINKYSEHIDQPHYDYKLFDKKISKSCEYYQNFIDKAVKHGTRVIFNGKNSILINLDIFKKDISQKIFSICEKEVDPIRQVVFYYFKQNKTHFKIYQEDGVVYQLHDLDNLNIIFEDQ